MPDSATHEEHGVAGALLGETLEGGYRVIRKLPWSVDHPERNRSCCYEAVGPSGEKYFVKAYDFRHEERSGKLEDLVAAGRQFISEKDIHSKASTLRRSTHLVSHGTINIGSETAHYLVSEWVDVCLKRRRPAGRGHATAEQRFIDLRQVCSSLIQLHRSGIAHQDVKPSNVMVDPVGVLKMTDYGVSTCSDLAPPPSDSEMVPGDVNFAPFESLYAQRTGSWRRQRLGGDMFMLGNLCFYSFSGLPIAQVALSMLPPELQPASATVDYSDIVPHIIKSMSELVESVLEGAGLQDEIRDEVVRLVLELCHPDPRFRGDARDRARNATYELQRYESAFERLRLKSRRFQHQ